MLDLTTNKVTFYEQHAKRESREIEWFWDRIEHQNFVNGKKVLDFGCGLGTLSIDLVEKGADEVHGIEISEEYHSFALLKRSTLAPRVSKKLLYFVGDLAQLENNSYDVIISKDVLEHVDQLADVFPTLLNKLKPGGTILLGFGPLWYSPFGDHGISQKITGFKIPWLHLFISEARILEYLKKTHGDNGETVERYGFNRLTTEEYERIFQSDERLIIHSKRVNLTNNPFAVAAGFFRLLPQRIYSKFFIRTVYLVGEKRM